MSSVYNFLQILLLPLSLPVLVIIVLLKKKYRKRILHRLGAGLSSLVPAGSKKKRIWMHCLSVGEVTSALPLVREIRRRTDTCIIFSVTTRSGMEIARSRIEPYVDALIAAPLDLLPVIERYLNQIRPDLFILVETDFWPNWLFSLQRRHIPSMLVNGRISLSSHNRYKRFRMFFTPVFNSFSLLAVQTEQDRLRFADMGVPMERIISPGNLKYGNAVFHEAAGPDHESFRLSSERPVWLCGSTHPGEEEILLAAFACLQKEGLSFSLVIAPRDPGRTSEIIRIAAFHGLDVMRRSRPADPRVPIMILDTLGELADAYRLARVAFIGGSMVNCGGHNPLEAAVCGIPVLFGPHMEDFSEIARDLELSGGGRTVRSQEELTGLVRQFITNDQLQETAGRASRRLVEQNNMVIARYMESVFALLNQEKKKTEGTYTSI